jgi:hypothetical protein
MSIIRQGTRADIGLLLEGTFPYVSGGVSSWVNQIIRGFPEYTFASVLHRQPPRGLWRHALRTAGQRGASGNPLPARWPRKTARDQPSRRPGGVQGSAQRMHEQFRNPTAPSGCPSLIGNILAAPGRRRTARLSLQPRILEFHPEQYRASTAPTPRLSITSGRCASCTRRCGG